MPIAIARADGGVSIMHLAPGADVAAEIAKWQGAHPGQYVSHEALADADIPKDRSKRADWSLSGKAIRVAAKVQP
jgi:hypothetical protein